MKEEKNHSIYKVFENHATLSPHKFILAVQNEQVTYEKFVHNTNLIGKALSAIGVSANKKIGIILPNSVLWYEIFWAAVKLGAQPVPLDPQIGEWEMERLLSLAEIEVCFIVESYRANNINENIIKIKDKIASLTTIISLDKPKNVIESKDLSANEILYFEHFLEKGRNITFSPSSKSPSKHDILMLACTSGSTGNPKIISVPHRGFYKSQKDMAAHLKFSSEDKMLLGMPLYHQGGFGMGLQVIIAGGTVYYLPIFNPEEFLTVIQEKKITIVQLTSTLAKILISVPNFEKYDLSSLKMCYFAGEVLPKELAKVFYQDLKIRVINIIGSSETGTIVIWDSDTDHEVDVNEFSSLPFNDLMVLDENMQDVDCDKVGRIFIHTDALIKEYYGNKIETDLKLHDFNGKMWFNTGDLGIKRRDGRIRFAGREKRIIKRGANLVYPEEIESFLLSHPDVEAVAVSSENHELIGEMIVSYIQTKNGVNINRGNLAKYLKGKLAAYKIPDKVIHVSEIPHDIGKVQFKYLNKTKEIKND